MEEKEWRIEFGEKKLEIDGELWMGWERKYGFGERILEEWSDGMNGMSGEGLEMDEGFLDVLEGIWSFW